MIFPEGRQHLTSPRHFWDAMGVFVQANPGTAVMSVLVSTPTKAVLTASSKPQHVSQRQQRQTYPASHPSTPNHLKSPFSQ